MKATCVKPASPLAKDAFLPNQSGKLGTKIMHKLYTGCINCTKHADPFTCPEKAMIRRVRERNL